MKSISADTLESQFEEAGAIAAVVRWPDLELEIVQLGIEKGQGIRQEDIDVVALAVVDLQHHRRAAAERPRIDDDLLGIDLAYSRAGDTKKTRPVWSVRAHAASG